MVSMVSGVKICNVLNNRRTKMFVIKCNDKFLMSKNSQSAPVWTSVQAAAFTTSDMHQAKNLRDDILEYNKSAVLCRI